MRNDARSAGRASILWGAIGALSSLSLSSQTPARPPQRILGVYGTPTAGHDSVRITENAAGRIGVNLKFYYSNGHTCQLNKDGEWRDDHVAIVADGLDTNRPCRLNLVFENGFVRLKDEGFQCAPVYCGTRGKLDNVRLPKAGPNRK